MKFTVDRSKWRFGGGKHFDTKGETQLLNNRGYMCCLGFCMKQLGLDDNLIRDKAAPANVMLKHNDFVSCGPYGTIKNSSLSMEAMRINDNDNISGPERERRLIELFSEHGHEIEFVGEYPEEI